MRADQWLGFGYEARALVDVGGAEKAATPEPENQPAFGGGVTVLRR